MAYPKFLTTLSGEIMLSFMSLPKKVFLLIILREMPNSLKLFCMFNFNHLCIFILKIQKLRFTNCRDC